MKLYYCVCETGLRHVVPVSGQPHSESYDMAALVCHVRWKQNLVSNGDTMVLVTVWW
jgi:hypothetical protein